MAPGINRASSSAAGREKTLSRSPTRTSTATPPAPPAAGEIDFVTATGLLVTIPAGQTSVTIPIATNPDNLDEIQTDESNEAFTLSIDAATVMVGGFPAPATSGMVVRGTAIGTIVDDDGGARLTVDNPTVRESDGTVTFNLFLSQPQNTDILIYFYTFIDNNAAFGQAVGTVVAQPNEDYLFTSGPTVPPFLNLATILRGSNGTTVTVPLVNDVTPEKMAGYEWISERGCESRGPVRSTAHV